MKHAVLLCSCGGTLNIDFKNLKKRLGCDVLTFDYLCWDAVANHARTLIERENVDKILICCTAKKKKLKVLFEGFEPEFLNIRELCGWVHDRRSATEKALGIIKSKLISMDFKPEKYVKNVGSDVLIVGDIPAALEIADLLKEIANVRLLSPLPLHSENIEIFCGDIIGVRGELGNFVVEYNPNPVIYDRCILCGACVKICPLSAVRYGGQFGIDMNTCNRCGECVKICPTNAISFERETEQIKATHVVFIGIKPEIRKRGIYLLNNLESLTELINDLGEVELTRWLKVHPEKCAGGMGRFRGCDLCKDVCKYGAIRLKDKPVIDYASCVGCAACQSVCPTSVFEVPSLDIAALEALLDVDLTPKVVLFACRHSANLMERAGINRMKYFPVLPLIVDNLTAVSDVHVLAAFDRGADGVILVGCKDCLNSLSKTYVLDFVKEWLEVFGINGRLLLIAADESYAASDFVRDVNSFCSGLKQIKRRVDGKADLSGSSKRDNLIQHAGSFIRKFGNPKPFYGDKYPFASIRVSESCTLCNACGVMCPVNAIKKEEGRLLFNYSRCIACSLCQQACPEKAISMMRIVDILRLAKDEYEKVFETEVIYCKGCGKPFISRAMDKKVWSIVSTTSLEEFNFVGDPTELVKYCNRCRSMIIAKKMAGLGNEGE